MARFARELQALGGKAHVVPPGGAQARVLELLRERGVDRVQMGDDVPGVDEAGLAAGGVQGRRESADAIRAGITGALAGIVETGSLVIAGGPGRPLTASLVPEIHLAVLNASQLVPTVADALALPGVRQTAAAAIVTGPSRTADIEMTLSHGVHGPKQIHVILTR